MGEIQIPMDNSKRKRKRGVTLSSQGLHKLELARDNNSELCKKFGTRPTLEALSDFTSLSPDTLTKVFGAEERVDKQTLRRCFKAFSLVLEPADLRSSTETEASLESAVADIGPSLGLELPRGQVPLDSRFYIARQPLETKCYEAIREPGALIRIKAPKQMGKTSLMAKILATARTQDYATVTLSLLLAEESVFASLERFLKWFCACISQSLGLPNRLEDLWLDILGNSVNVISYFEQHLLAAIDRPMVLALDDIDCIFQHPEVAADFFGLLRAMHEKAKYGDGQSEAWQKLRMVVVHSTEVYIPLQNNQSPFNVGLSIELPEFTPSQVLTLAQQHRLPWHEGTVGQLMAYVGGHPMLVRQALYYIARQEISLPELVATSSNTNSIYGDYLRRLLNHLQQHPHLMMSFRQVLKSALPVQLDPRQGFILHSLGLVHFHETMATLSCQLYRQYFQDIL